ncbi:MAG: protease inhibitor I42 family protein [Anaerolineae bacterium]|nr:protease inhibitor I42 family protein [Anaerolineae bacterium]
MKRILGSIGALMLVAALASMAFIPVAQAHSEPSICTPPIDSTVATAPDKVVCTTTQSMDPANSELEVFDASGTQVDEGDSAVDLNDPDRKTISVSLDPAKLSDGVYTVKWATLSTEDNEAEEGEFTFTISGTGAQPTATATAAAEPTRAGTQGEDDAAAYCNEKGGTVTTRYPTYNTNASVSGWLRLAGARDFCTFHAPADSTGFQSQISIALDTLYADEPTLAVLAYLEPVSLPPFTGANPSTGYCTKLGGTDVFGGMNSAAGGGWVTDESDSAANLQVVSMCVFPDLSSIDSWGLTYKANGVVRGVDLTGVVRYQPTALPNVFVSDSSPNHPAAGTIDHTLTASDNGSTVDMAVGDTLQVELPTNPSTGYSWKVASNNASVLVPLGAAQFDLKAQTTPMPGAGGTQTFHFQAVGKGQTPLTLVYVRPWETSITPTPNDTWTVQVTVE